MEQLLDIPAFKALLLDDHIMFSQGLAELIKKMSPESDIKYYNSVENAKKAMLNDEFQFLLCDIIIPGSDTKEFITYCRKHFPHLPIIIISSILDISIIKEYFGLGVNAYLSKAVNNYELRLALEKTYHGEKYISSDLSGKLATSVFLTEKNTLTRKELEIIRLVAAGHTVDKSAALLNISPYTVMAHRRNIMKKLQIDSAAKMVKYAFEQKLI